MPLESFLGAKGVGEAGTIGSTPCIVAASDWTGVGVIGAVGDLLDQRLPDALRQPPVNLPLDDERIDEVVGVVERHHLQQPRLARLPVDLQHRDVAAERIGVVRRLEERRVAASST